MMYKSYLKDSAKSSFFCTNIFAIYKYLCTIDFMGMKIIKKVRDTKELKNYGIMKALRDIGVEVTTQGIDGYEKDSARSMRLDVLSGLRRISGVSWEEFGGWIDPEFKT
jgi:hypothetical protein